MSTNYVFEYGNGQVLATVHGVETASFATRPSNINAWSPRLKADRIEPQTNHCNYVVDLPDGSQLLFVDWTDDTPTLAHRPDHYAVWGPSVDPVYTEVVVNG